MTETIRSQVDPIAIGGGLIRKAASFPVLLGFLLVAAGFAAALGLNSRLAIVGSARAQPAPAEGKGFYKYKVGSVEVTALSYSRRSPTQTGATITQGTHGPHLDG